MTIWRWAVLAGLLAMAISVGFGQIPGIHACNLHGDAILNFEFVKTPADVASLFPENCRVEHVAAQRHGLWLDSLGFIPAYTTFLILSLVGLQTEGSGFGRRIAGTGVVLTLIAALIDQTIERAQALIDPARTGRLRIESISAKQRPRRPGS